MMETLQAKDPRFCQVIVIDRQVEIFRRLWCVAEMVQAYFSGMEQRVLLPSVELLEQEDCDRALYWRLATFSVRQCVATRPEDRDAILARIPDVREFDATLQGLVFAEHGILTRYYSGFRIVEAAVQVVRRVSDASGTTRRRTGQLRAGPGSVHVVCPAK
eukprot:SRR837773.7559.p1 GENE.SRR837773.7559~~SRR837773.7559.p1  ORF type:complete len:160 (+),score=40.09 SRR837773.7559:369-848(+)